MITSPSNGAHSSASESSKKERSYIRQEAKNLTEDVSNLLDTYYKLGILNTTEKATGVASTTLVFLLTGILSLFVFLFLGFGLAYWLGVKLQNMLAGFFIVAGVYVLIIAVILALRKNVIFPFIRNTIIKKVYE
jgi:hypothetical protein